MDDVLGSVSWIPTDVLKWMAQKNGWLIEFGPLKQLQACNTNLPPPTMQATLWAKKNKCGGHFIHDS